MNKFDRMLQQDLEDKFKTVIESLVVKSKKNEDSVAIEDNDNIIEEKTELEVENVSTDSLETEEKLVLTEVSVESPSVHTEDKEEKMTDKTKSLGNFEKKIVNEYKQILADHGEFAAAEYFATKVAYLPRGFDPTNF